MMLDGTPRRVEIPECSTYMEFASFVESDLQRRGIYYNADTLLDHLNEYAGEYIDKYGVDPDSLPY